MRISGLASGMDTDQIIKDLMKANRMPLDKIFQRKQYMEWQRDDYRTVNKKLFDFKILMSDKLNRPSTFTAKSVTSSKPDDVSIRNVSASSNFTGTINITTVASAANMQSNGQVIATEEDLTKKLSDLVPSPTVPSSFVVKGIQKDGSLETTGYMVNVTADSTLQSIIDDINKNSQVNAIFDPYTKLIAVTAKNSGTDVASGKEIEFVGAFANSFLKLDTDNSVADSYLRGDRGTNAVFELNGLQTQRSTNTFQISGYEITIKQSSGVDINFSSATDTDKIFEDIKGFVDQYNKLIEDLNGEIREKKNRDFQPLSSEQKAELSEKEIEMWEEKAKSGTLRNDSIISGVLTSMRSILNEVVSTSSGGRSLADIGITTSKAYAENGKLVIDNSKLRTAITEDPNKVYELFGTSDVGLAEKVIAEVDERRKQIISKAGSEFAVNNSFSLGRSLNAFNDQITRFTDKLSMIEDRYYRQFSAMEAAIQRANAQSAQLMSSFGGGQ